LQSKDPCLVNVGGDPLLNGCLMYSLLKGQTVRVGSDPGATICIDGLGVQRQMCQIVNGDGGHIELFVGDFVADLRCGSSGSCKMSSPVSDDRTSGLFKTGLVQVFVNNALVAGQAQLQPGDFVRFGASHCFQLIAEDMERASASVGLKAAADPGENILTPEHEAQLRERYGSQRASAILAKLEGIRPLIEEANGLTDELRADEGFELVFDFAYVTGEPEVTVVLHKRDTMTDRGAEGSAQPPETVRCLWTVEKFRHRLEVMRDIYSMVNERGKPWGREDDLNPWMDDAGVPLVNPALATAPSSPGRLGTNAALYAEIEELRGKLTVQSDELEVMASLRDRLVNDVVVAQQEAVRLQTKLNRTEAQSKVSAEVYAREEEVEANLKPEWLQILGHLRERREAIDVPSMHSWLEPHERLLDYAQKLSCNVKQVRSLS